MVSSLSTTRILATLALALASFSHYWPAKANPHPADAADSNRNDLAVLRENERNFRISRPGSPPIRLTVLTAQTFRVHLLQDGEAASRLPEYMQVKADATYPAVDVGVETRRDEATFTTAGASFHLAIEGDLVSVELRASGRPLIEHWRIRATQRTSQLDLRPGERIYGFGDKRAALDQRGQRLEMINRDAFASETNESYKSIPFYMSSAGYGLFFHNFYPSAFDVGAADAGTLALEASSGSMDFYLFVGDLKEVLSQYTELTGRPALLPRWAFGYHQGKASYKGREAFAVADEMRRRNLPVDVIYYDDWVEEATNKPFIDQLWERYRVRLTLGFGMPMFGRFRGMDDSAFLRDLAARGYLMVDQYNRPVIRPDEYVDPGDETSSVAYLDYFSAHAVDHVFATRWERALRNGVNLGMVDFGEMDHLADSNNKYWPSLGMSVAKTRNLFGLVYPLSIVAGVIRRTGDRSTGMVRPGFAGTQRLGWATTGNSVPTYANFRAHTRAMLNLTLSGFSNVGQDIGGWDSKGPDILYARWFAAGTFHPFMWSHGQGDHEPYSHGPIVENAARQFLDLRYRLVPLLYSLHHQANRTGIPILRPLALQESADAAAARIDDQFFIGDDILVAPVFNDEGDRNVYLPRGFWYDFFGDEPPATGGREIRRTAVPLDRLPVYVRAGAVIPLGPAMQYTDERPVDPLTVHVYGFAGTDLAAGPRSSEFVLYEDDGQGTAYRRGRLQNTSLRFRQDTAGSRFEISAVSGNGKYRSVALRGYRLHFHGLQDAIGRIVLDGDEIPRAETAANAPARASWWVDPATRDVLVAIPASPKRDFVVEMQSEDSDPSRTTAPIGTVAPRDHLSDR